MQGAVLLPYQKQWIACDAPFAIYLKSRRIGISWAEALWSVRRRLTKKIDHYFVSADLNTAKEFIRYCRLWAEVINVAVETEVVDLNGVTTECLTMPNGARIVALSSNPTAVRGKGGDATLDEFAFHEWAAEMYTAAQPVRQWGGVIRIISTPAGPGTVFSKLVREAPDNGFALFKTTLLDAVAQGLAEKVPGEHQKLEPKERDAAFIEGIKKTCLSESAYRQEYLCEDASEETIITPEAYAACILKGSPILSDLDPKAKYSHLYVGVDIGRSRNLTVIWVVERGHDPTAPEHLQDVYRTVAKLELANVPFQTQFQRIDAFLSHRSVHRACIDAGGIGAQLAEDLQAKYGARVEPVHISRPVKATLVERAAKYVHQQRVSLPDDDVTRDDICAMRRIPLTGGGFSYDGQSGKSHCDRYIALAMALQAAEQPAFRVWSMNTKGRDAEGQASSTKQAA